MGLSEQMIDDDGHVRLPNRSRLGESSAGAPVHVRSEHEVLQHWEQIESTVRPLLEGVTERSAARVMRGANKRRASAPLFAVGDAVMLSESSGTLTRKSYSGPYTIVSQRGHSYELQASDGTLRPSPVAANKLKLVAHASPDDEWKVSAITDHRYTDGPNDGGLELLTFWHGFAEPTWEPVSHFRDEDSGIVTEKAAEYAASAGVALFPVVPPSSPAPTNSQSEINLASPTRASKRARRPSARALEAGGAL